MYEDELYDDYSEDDTMDIDFDVDEYQEMQDFAQDDEFHNMEPMEDGFWG